MRNLCTPARIWHYALFGDAIGTEHLRPDAHQMRIRQTDFRPLHGAPAALLVLALATDCSFIQFEQGPYVIREIAMVYSQQEKMTFLSWKIRDDAEDESVHFELHRGGVYQALDLDAAPYPAEPYRCGDSLCYQYQLSGRYAPPAGISPLRSIHVDEGIYPGPRSPLQEIETSFSIRPIGLQDNSQIDPNRGDWFAENDVELRRSYRWQFVDYEPSIGCREPNQDRWKTMDAPVKTATDWVEGPVCFSSQPLARRRDGIIVSVPIVGSAQTRWDSQTYAPPNEESPIAVALVLDLEIPNSSRCSQIKSWLIDSVETELESRGPIETIDIYTPLSASTGLPTDGCKQAALQDYPIEVITADLRDATDRLLPQRTRAIIIYVNNLDLPPSQRVADQMSILFDTLSADEPTLFAWAIGSNVTGSLAPWDAFTGWRPIEDGTFFADLRATIRSSVPFRTMIHTPETRVQVNRPDGLATPLFAKLCRTTPFPYSWFGVNPTSAHVDKAITWPTAGVLPGYQVAIPSQILVPNTSFVRRKITATIEVCTRFCDHPFRSQSGIDHESWLDTPMEVCQWYD
jgi:hypothetical protein